MGIVSRIKPGRSYPLGATYDGSGTNFSLFSEAAQRVELALLSQGVPMIAHGDELGRTQQGHTNVYCQDNELS